MQVVGRGGLSWVPSALLCSARSLMPNGSETTTCSGGPPAGPRVTTSPLRGPSSRTARNVESLIATGFPPQRRTIPRPAGRHLGLGTQHRSRGSHLRVSVAVRQAIALVGVRAGVVAHAPDPAARHPVAVRACPPAAPACRTRSTGSRIGACCREARSCYRRILFQTCWRPALGCGAIDVAVASPVAASASVGDHLGKAGQRTLARFRWFASVQYHSHRYDPGEEQGDGQI
ncbi:MAG: hypothetical protein QOG57_411 [Pseudonocardiales bacterium]|nr:hypothetical protein [Pseudonocardiales bacterium]